jgi:hypothetical protein
LPAAFIVAAAPAKLFAQEHPTEHPSKVESTKASRSSVTLEDIATYINGYVKDKSVNGSFKIDDKGDRKQLLLKLDRVHRNRLSQVGPAMFFACTDFISGDGKHTYDIDFFVEGTSKENLTVLEDKIAIHKEDGKERYTWELNKTSGLWEQKPIDKSNVKDLKTGSQSLDDAQLIQPDDFVELLKSNKEDQPLILQVGVLALYNQGHIPGSEYVGPASDSNGLQKLRERAKNLPKDKFIVFYCGCCPWNDCPNSKPAFQELKALGFSNAKLLYVPSSFKRDWVAKGYPVDAEK